jgi:hypothetical protein
MIKTIINSEAFTVICVILVIVLIAVGLGTGICKYCDADHAARIAERDRQAALQYEHERQQTAMVDSISVVFMKAWAKAKDTEEFKHCAYYRFRANTSYDGTVDLVQADISCGEIKDLPDIGKFKPTAMVPGAEGAAMTVIYKFFPNK